VVPLVVCVTDGLPTVPLVAGRDPLGDALFEARALRRAGVGLVVADTGAGGGQVGACTELAEAGGGVRVRFGQLVPATFLELLDGVEAAC
jgi:Mg-chelatase subunit ChlD